MSDKDRIIIFIALVVMAVGLFIASLLSGPINAQREKLQLTVNPDVLKNMPADIAFFQLALGGFRGLAVDYLWERATRLKDDGKFHEAMQLANWITKLQPKFVKVWDFQAWNMAWNISVATHTREERWMWVEAGIDLLRSEGIPINPRSALLHKELAWIYLSKIGQASDDMHWYYKSQVAKRWHELLGEPPVRSSSEMLAWFKPIVEACDVIDGAGSGGLKLAAYEVVYPGVAGVAKKLSDAGFKLDEQLLARVTYLRERVDYEKVGLLHVGETACENETDKVLVSFLGTEELDRLLAFVRAMVLRDEYNMEPRFMYRLMESEGPIDWRHPAAHGIYWSAKGVEAGDQVIGYKDKRFIVMLNTNRQVMHGLQMLTHRGRITYNLSSEYPVYFPDARFIGAYERYFKTSGTNLSEKAEETAAPETFKAGHENFLIWATTLAYMDGDMVRASKYYKELRDLYSSKEGREGVYTVPLNAFVMDYSKIRENLSNTDDARQMVTSFISQAITRGLVGNEPRFVDHFLSMAKDIHGYYKKIIVRDTYGSKRGRQALPAFGKMVNQTMIDFMLASSGRVSLDKKVRCWNRMVPDTKRRIFDTIRVRLYQEARRAGYDPERMFPEPEGMAAYRKAHPNIGTEVISSEDALDLRVRPRDK